MPCVMSPVHSLTSLQNPEKFQNPDKEADWFLQNQSNLYYTQSCRQSIFMYFWKYIVSVVRVSVFQCETPADQGATRSVPRGIHYPGILPKLRWDMPTTYDPILFHHNIRDSFHVHTPKPMFQIACANNPGAPHRSPLVYLLAT